MAQKKTPSFDFLTEYVLAMLDENGITLSDEQKKAYVPELLAEAEQRLGAALLPKLSDQQLTALNTILQKGNTDAKTLESFWREALPSLEEDVQSVLRDFALEVNDLLAA